MGSCYRFLGEEVSGYSAANDRCEDVGPGYHLPAELDPSSTAYLVNRMERRRKNGGQGSKAVMLWLGAKRDPASTYNRELWNWVTGGRVAEGAIDWGRGQPNNYNQEQDCAVLDSDLDWGWNDISCRISGELACQGRPRRCPSPPVGKGSYYSLEEEGRLLRYHCPVGEMPVGQAEQECGEDGEWSGDGPIECKKVDCGQVRPRPLLLLFSLLLLLLLKLL